MTKPTKNQPKNTKILDMFIRMGYDDHAPAKSGVGIGVPNYTGHTTAPCAVFVCHTSPIMVGLVGVSLTRRNPVLRYANPASPATLKLAFFGGGLSQPLTGKPAMNTHSVSTALVQVFNFQSSHQVRIAFDDNGEPLFCLTDVADILALGNANPSRFALDEKGVHKMYTPTKGGVQLLTFISEPNLYRVIFRSNKAEAKRFQDWVFNEVLPTIRKTGSYHIDEPSLPTSPTLSTADYAIIKQAVYNISIGMCYKHSVTNAIYARLRHLCEVDSVSDLRYDHLPLIQNELYRIERTLAPYKKMRSETEKQLIRRICGEDDLAVSQAILDIERTATAYAKEKDKCLSAAFQIEKIGQIGGTV